MNKNLQETIERIVNQDVLTCQSSLVEELLAREIVSYDEITNMYPNNEDEIDEKKEELEKLQDKLNELENIEELTEEQENRINELENQISDIENRIEELENEQEEPQVIFEWWVVSDLLANELEEQGEPILKSDYETWWGRTCTGQSIKIDYVMEQIAEGLNNRINNI
jgi:DNA repair exonuclease SbcCD ATPase subunit